MINKNLIQNKKGATLSGMTEMVIGVVLFIGIISIIIISMNASYSQNYNPTFGLVENDTKDSLNQYSPVLGTAMEGEATTNAINGVNVVSAYGAIREGVKMVMNIVSGQFILNIVAMLHLGGAGDILGWALRLLYIFALGFIFIKVIFKVQP